MGSAVMQRKLNDARTLALSLGDQPAVLATYVSGSLTAGLGNTTSDADVFAVVGDEADLPASPPQYLAESGRIDVEYVRTGDLRACVERLGRFRVERESFTAARLPEDELDLLARFHYRLDAAPGPELAELAARLSGLQSRLRQALISHWSRVVSDALEDLRGAVLDDDPDTAVVVGQKLLLGAAKALAAGCGDYYVGAKWAFRQVRRSAPGFPLDRLRLAQRGGWADTAAPAASAGDGAIRLAQAMLAAAELLGWDEPLADRWPWPEPANGREGREAAADGPVLRRQTDCLPFRLDRGVLLNRELVRQHVVQTGIAAVWALCDGPIGDVQARYAQLSEQVELSLPGAATVPDVVRALAARQLIDTDGR